MLFRSKGPRNSQTIMEIPQAFSVHKNPACPLTHATENTTHRLAPTNTHTPPSGSTGHPYQVIDQLNNCSILPSPFNLIHPAKLHIWDQYSKAPPLTQMQQAASSWKKSCSYVSLPMHASSPNWVTSRHGFFANTYFYPLLRDHTEPPLDSRPTSGCLYLLLSWEVGGRQPWLKFNSPLFYLLPFFYHLCSLVAQRVKNLPVIDTGSIPGLGRSLEKGMATLSSVLAWEIP